MYLRQFPSTQPTNVQKKKRHFFGEKKKNKEAKKTKGVFVETYAVAPAPSRDYYALKLYQKKFLLTKWKICHGPFVSPTQRVVSLDEYKKDATLQHEITYIFGRDTTNLISDLANEKWSLTSMPSNVLQKIFSYINVSDILRLSQVCKRLSKECSSNDVWKTICKKQWKILIHNDIEKAGLIGWKTVYLEKMRPKRYRHETGHHHHHHHHLVKSNFSNLSRIHSVSTLNTPDSRGLTTKSNFTIPKRVQELKRCDTIRSNSEIFGKDFKVTSVGTGKSTERTYTVNKGKTCSKQSETRPVSGEKMYMTPRKYMQHSSSSTITLLGGLEKPATETVRRKSSPRVIKSKVTSIRARSATTQSVQPTTIAQSSSKVKTTRPSTVKPVQKK
ncbi:hypothetical protein RUM43_003062 [Polyplax serrata]|uniref:F-box domain-containing protein n=1 Tax=Polyplax serrata TaxID=468196 RepID=A0AAN8P2W3_POLSC